MEKSLLRGRTLPVLLAIFAIVFVDNVDVSALSVALPVIADELGVPLSGVQWVMSIYFVASASFFLLAGYLGDRFGIRDTLCVGVGLIVLSSAFGGFSSGLGELVFWRFVQGVGYALTFSMTMLLTKDLLPEGKRDLGMGVFMGVATLSSMAGPLLGSVMTEALGWRSLFFINVALCAPCIVALLRNLGGGPSATASRDPRTLRTASLVGQVLLAFGLLGATTALLLFAEGQVNEAKGHTVWPGLGFGLGLAAISFLGVFLLRRGSPAPADGGLRLILQNRPFVVVVATRVVLQAVSYSSFFWLPIVLQRGLGYDLVETGFVLTAFTAAAAASAFGAGALAERWGRRAVSVGGHVLLIAGLLALAGVGLRPGASTGVLVVCLVFVGAGFSAVFTVVSAGLLQAISGGPEGRLVGVYYTCSYIAGSLAVAATTWLGGGGTAEEGVALLDGSQTLAWLWLAGVMLSLVLSLDLRESAGTPRAASSKERERSEIRP